MAGFKVTTEVLPVSFPLALRGRTHNPSRPVARISKRNQAFALPRLRPTDLSNRYLKRSEHRLLDDSPMNSTPFAQRLLSEFRHLSPLSWVGVGRRLPPGLLM